MGQSITVWPGLSCIKATQSGFSSPRIEKRGREGVHQSCSIGLAHFYFEMSCRRKIKINEKRTTKKLQTVYSSEVELSHVEVSCSHCLFSVSPFFKEEAPLQHTLWKNTIIVWFNSIFWLKKGELHCCWNLFVLNWKSYYADTHFLH